VREGLFGRRAPLRFTERTEATMRDETKARTGLLAATDGLRALAATQAADAESTRSMDGEVFTAMVAAGFARHFVPARWGGDEGTFAELTPAVAEVGRGCASTAWCASLVANLARMAAFLPPEGCDDVWSTGPDTVVVGSLTPLGRVTPVDGGWLLFGQWPYISAVEQSDWVLVAGIVPDDGGAAGGAARPGGTVRPPGRPPAKVLALPRADYGYLDTWFNVGMRATGSHTVVVEDAFVPAHRAFEREDLFAGHALGSDAACHAVPLQAANALSFAGPVLGAARGALDSWCAYIAQKLGAVPAAPGGGPGLSRASHDATLTRASSEIDAAELLLMRASRVADKGGAVTPAETVRNLRDGAFAVEVLATAVDRLFRAAGTTGQSAANPMQRFWRDANAMATHVALQFEPAAHAYAGEVLGR
jgi:alkylation response protein AidB-like acyl-CoA dehydrogenase